MKRVVLLLISWLTALGINAQSYDVEIVAFTNFLTRMYKDSPFEGVRAVNDDYNDKAYILVALSLEKSKYKSDTVLNRVASVKAMAEASRFFNGSNITQDLVIHTTENSNGMSDTEIIENIKEHSSGYVKALERLTSFPAKEEGRQVFLFVKRLDMEKH